MLRICGSKWHSGGHWDYFLSIFGRFWGSLGRLVGVICAPMGALAVIFGALDRHLKGLGPTFERNLVEKSVFVILVPRLGEPTTFEGPVAQVGATWSRKSCQRRTRGGQGGGRDGKKGAKRGQSGRRVCRASATHRKSSATRTRPEVKTI